MFDNLDNYFNPVIDALPELHKSNINTTNLERKMKVLRLLVNQEDFRDRLNMGLLYYKFYQSVQDKCEVSCTTFKYRCLSN